VAQRQPCIIHVGFANTGTTSLQQNFFAQREDIFYVGQPYGERGGIFTFIRHAEDFKYDETQVSNLCNFQIFGISQGRKIVISDEMLCDSPQLYYAPYMVPRDIIAMRLSRLFQPARIVFTIRNQEEYVCSMYLNLKRNCAFFSRMPIPPFSQWYWGMLSQFRCHFLQNLNFCEVINVYRQLFGRENILVLPLEKLINDGPRQYLGALCEFADLPLSSVDLERYDKPRNTRMSAMKALAADMIFDGEFFDFYSGLQERLGQEELEKLLDAGDRAAAGLEPEDLADLRQRAAAANRQLAEEYDVELERYGYPLGEGGEAISRGADSTASPQLVGELNEPFAAEREASVSPFRQLEWVRRPLPKINDGLRHWFNLARSLGK
jgi:hypothetical protein